MKSADSSAVLRDRYHRARTESSQAHQDSPLAPPSPSPLRAPPPPSPSPLRAPRPSPLPAQSRFGVGSVSDERIYPESAGAAYWIAASSGVATVAWFRTRLSRAASRMPPVSRVRSTG